MSKIKRIEFKYDDGTVASAEGEDAEQIRAGFDNALLIAAIHGHSYTGPSLRIEEFPRDTAEKIAEKTEEIESTGLASWGYRKDKACTPDLAKRILFGTLTALTLCGALSVSRLLVKRLRP